MDINAIAQVNDFAKEQMLKKREATKTSGDDAVDLEELAKVYEEENSLKQNQSSNKSTVVKPVKKSVIVYLDAGEYFGIDGADEVYIIDVSNLRRNIVFEKGDSFVWDKGLVKGLGEMSNIDKIGQTEEIYDVCDDCINDYDRSRFTRSFNPLTYKKGAGNISSEN